MRNATPRLEEIQQELRQGAWNVFHLTRSQHQKISSSSLYGTVLLSKEHPVTLESRREDMVLRVL